MVEKSLKNVLVWLAAGLMLPVLVALLNAVPVEAG